RLLAADPGLLSAVHRSFVRLVFLTLRAKAPVARGRCGAVSFLETFDSSLGLDLHAHLSCLDGVYAARGDGTAMSMTQATRRTLVSESADLRFVTAPVLAPRPAR